MNPTELLRSYKVGCGFRPDDVLRPRVGAAPVIYGVIGGTVVVLEQSILAPHQYTVVGERGNPRSPADRFVKFEINGHEWEKVGQAGVIRNHNDTDDLEIYEGGATAPSCAASCGQARPIAWVQAAWQWLRVW